MQYTIKRLTEPAQSAGKWKSMNSTQCHSSREFKKKSSSDNGLTVNSVNLTVSTYDPSGDCQSVRRYLKCHITLKGPFLLYILENKYHYQELPRITRNWIYKNSHFNVPNSVEWHSAYGQIVCWHAGIVSIRLFGGSLYLGLQKKQSEIWKWNPQVPQKQIHVCTATTFSQRIP